MNKHTPGPWYINPDSSDCGTNKLSIETIDEYFIAQVDEGMYQQANAQLIAAAPDLLEALQMCWDLGIPTVCVEKVKAAIAKATQPITKE